MALLRTKFLSSCTFIFFVFLYFFQITNCQNVFGCGGFIKSDFPIDFSAVEVKLYTKQGALKFQTDCAPNNGYYLIPVYDKGDYIIKVEPPEGWYFEPSSTALNIDGSTDVCSQSKDINFYFKGFQIKGQVVSRGLVDGPADVKLTLTSENEPQKTIQETFSQQHGFFFFEKVLPGNYLITASHQDLSFELKTVAINVNKESVSKLVNNLIISGYNVKGCVVGDDGDFVHGVHFILFGSSDKNSLPKKCEPGLPKGYDIKSSSFKTDMTPLCYVTSLNDGCFNFPIVVPGDYVIVPFYRSKNIKFDVVPSKQEIKVEHSSLIIKPEFKVEGFSVSGRILTSQDGNGLANAAVLLNGKVAAVSQNDGTYHLENMRAGSYEIQVKAEKIKFDTQVVKINPNSPNLQDIIPSEFEVCGVLEGDDISKNVQHKITFTSADVDTKKYSTSNDPNGVFCAWLPSGLYIGNVGTETELPSIIFKPSRLRVTVRDSPLSNLKFSQYKSSVSGKVECLEPCSDLVKVYFRPVKVSNYQVTPQTIQLPDTSTFVFSDVIPGKYEVSVINPDWCWEKRTYFIEVGDSDKSDIVFIHKGYWLTITATHPTTVNYKAEHKQSQDANLKTPNATQQLATPITGTLEVSRGTNKMCLDRPLVYTMQFAGCHIFSVESFVFDTSKPSPLALEAVKHLISGIVTSTVNANNIRIRVKKIVEGETPNSKEDDLIVGPLVGKPIQNDKFEYKFHYWSAPQQKFEVHPLSPDLLFYPEKQLVDVLENCIEKAAIFVGRKGLFLEGQINPPLAGVKITLFSEDGKMKPIVLETGDDGRYRVGPLHSDSKYDVQAEKIGYILTKESEMGHFSAFKLAEIAVSVHEDLPNKLPLAGVILSVSGGKDYRQNSLTQEDGMIRFTGLGPGQYYLRAMMKEYQFDPPSKMVEVSEGEGVNVVLKGKRVAFSCFGTVTTLVGEPEKQVVIEAVGRGNCSMYQEEVTSEDDGTFRIRGLKPYCEYEIGLKKASEINTHIERSTPNFHLIKITNGDVEVVNLIVFRPIHSMDVSGMVITPKEFYNNLKVRLTGEDGTQHVRSLSHSNFFHFFSLPMKDQQYTLSLETNVPRNIYSYEVPTEITFRANESYRHFKFHFKPTLRSGEQEFGHGSYLALPFALLVAVILINHSKVVPFINKTVGMVRSLNNPVGRSQDDASSSMASSITSSSISSFETVVKRKVKSRKI